MSSPSKVPSSHHLVTPQYNLDLPWAHSSASLSETHHWCKPLIDSVVWSETEEWSGRPALAAALTPSPSWKKKRKRPSLSLARLSLKSQAGYVVLSGRVDSNTSPHPYKSSQVIYKLHLIRCSVSKPVCSSKENLQ
jgi:hypothetical protein